MRLGVLFLLPAKKTVSFCGCGTSLARCMKRTRRYINFCVTALFSTVRTGHRRIYMRSAPHSRRHCVCRCHSLLEFKSAVIWFQNKLRHEGRYTDAVDECYPDFLLLKTWWSNQKNQCADCSFNSIYRTRVRIFRSVPLFLPCNAGSVCFSDTALLYTLGKKLWGIFIVKTCGSAEYIPFSRNISKTYWQTPWRLLLWK